ncbi:MAG: RNA polymerase sigma-70 factor [Chitinophagaceae bacterium]|nr:RNA polymerase sigma-70 factor [Chitinophagaceae bacterium]MBP8243711.1 RNA polymerase sigma-70 factor [Chitinophagaceae bacterium]
MPENENIKRLLTAISVNNDQAAYRELFILLHARLKQFAYSILKSGEEAEELVSDVFIRIWQKREQLENINSPLLYFYTTTKNLALNQLSKQKRQVNLSPEEWLVQVNSLYFDPEQLMLTEEMFRQVKKAVNDLPPRCRLIFKLVKEDGLRYKEVAELLQLSVKTIEAQMAIALRRIGKCMHFELKTAIPARAQTILKK